MAEPSFLAARRRTTTVGTRHGPGSMPTESLDPKAGASQADRVCRDQSDAWAVAATRKPTVE